MLSYREDISFSLSILYKTLAEDLLLVQDLHRVKLVSLDGHTILVMPELLHQVDDAEGALTKLHDGLEVLWTRLLLLFFTLPLQLFVEFPDINELVLPVVSALIRAVFGEVELHLVLLLLLLLLPFHSLYEYFFVAKEGQTLLNK